MFYKLQELFWIVNDSERSWGIFRDSSWIPRRFCVNFKDPGGFFRDLFDPRRSLGDFFERFSRILPDWTRNPRNLLGFPTIFDDPVKIGSRIQGFLRSWTILLRNSQEFFRDPQIFSTIPDDPVGFFKHGSKLQPKSNGFWDPRRPWWIIQAILKTKPTIQGSFCHARRSWGILSGGQGCSTPPERNPKLTLGEHQTSQRLTDPEGFFFFNFHARWCARVNWASKQSHWRRLSPKKWRNRVGATTGKWINVNWIQVQKSNEIREGPRLKLIFAAVATFQLQPSFFFFFCCCLFYFCSPRLNGLSKLAVPRRRRRRGRRSCSDSIKSLLCVVVYRTSCCCCQVTFI